MIDEIKLVIDASYYQNYTQYQYDLLASVIDGAIIRTGFGLTEDSRAKTHLNEFRKRNILVSSYHWVDPTKDRNQQIAFIVATVKKYGLPSVFEDGEQYWSDWEAYMKQDLAKAFATRFTPEQLFNYYNYINSGLQDALIGSNIESAIYSSDWFINQYCPYLENILNKNYWDARYLRYYDPIAFNDLKKKIGIPFDISHVKDFKTIAPIIKGVGRQFESYLEIKGLEGEIQYHQDWNFFTEEGYNRMFHVAPSVKPNPIPYHPPMFRPI